jgi:hypothetical protein
MIHREITEYNLQTNKQNMKSKLLNLIAALAFSAGIVTAAPLGTAFTYQGRLNTGGNPAQGTYDLRFTIYDLDSGGSLVAGPITNSPVTVSNGLFTSTLDFGPGIFTGDARWLEIGVRTNGGSEFVLLAPRQSLTASPYALFAPGAGTAATASAVANKAVTAAGIATGEVVKSVNGLHDAVSLAAGANVSLNTVGNVMTLSATPGTVVTNAGWGLSGNSGTTATNYLGTRDGQPLELRANNVRALRIEPGVSSPNLIGGYQGNFAKANISGATVAGGGNSGVVNIASNNYTAIVGGYGNVAEGHSSFIGGGRVNHTDPNGAVSVIGGGYLNSSAGSYGVIGGGYNNNIGTNADYAAIGGGYNNDIAANSSYATISGGYGNTATGNYGTVPGGYDNEANASYSFAAGYRAKARHLGSFVWADNTAADFASTAQNQFLVRARGGVRFDTDSSISSDSPKGISLSALNAPMITREWDPFSSAAPADKVGLGRWGLFMEPYHLVAGIPDADAGDRAFAVWAYQTNGSHRELFFIRNFDGLAWFSNNVSVGSLTVRGGADVAEPFEMSSTNVPQGAVVIIDEARPGRLKLNERAYDTRVAGVVSGANGIQPGLSLTQEGLMEGGQNVALSGRVYVQADATYGAIKPGDLLTTSDTPGHAMRVTDSARAQGAILGKAMSALNEGAGFVLVLVTLQ